MNDVIVASHQPDLFPHTGFWYKMAHCQIFDLAVHDQFQLTGYQRRVKMRGQWAGLMLDHKKTYAPITELSLHPEAMPRLMNMIAGRYRDAKYWHARKHVIHDLMEMAGTFDKLWLANTVLIEGVATFLGIERQLHLNAQQTEHGAERVAERVQNAGGTVYLSGTGARSYMEENDPHFVSKGIRLAWSRHEHTTGDSILTAIFDDKDPLATVMRGCPPTGIAHAPHCPDCSGIIGETGII
ncbi:hypothetical protein SEA_DANIELLEIGNACE_95 [Arthrobacter phage DanielleIgnace]|nr:hypothetical protein SEA_DANIELLEIGNACE_95 [Arthrobacter phage DanielleIgnace]